jgi:hypothetical protein
MPITGTELLKMTESQLLELFQPTKCFACGVTLHESTTGCRKVSEGCVCSDCYFKAFSDELESHPICVPRMHRGA